MTRRDVCSDAEAMRVFEQLRNGIHPKWQNCIAGPGQEPKENEWIAPEKWIKRAFVGWGISLIIMVPRFQTRQ